MLIITVMVVRVVIVIIGRPWWIALWWITRSRRTVDQPLIVRTARWRFKYFLVLPPKGGGRTVACWWVRRCRLGARRTCIRRSFTFTPIPLWIVRSRWRSFGARRNPSLWRYVPRRKGRSPVPVLACCAVLAALAWVSCRDFIFS